LSVNTPGERGKCGKGGKLILVQDGVARWHEHVPRYTESRPHLLVGHGLE
jgi:hypothetical protein